MGGRGTRSSRRVMDQCRGRSVESFRTARGGRGGRTRRNFRDDRPATAHHAAPLDVETFGVECSVGDDESAVFTARAVVGDRERRGRRTMRQCSDGGDGHGLAVLPPPSVVRLAKTAGEVDSSAPSESAASLAHNASPPGYRHRFPATSYASNAVWTRKPSARFVCRFARRGQNAKTPAPTELETRDAMRSFTRCPDSQTETPRRGR